ncbi:hypothetical protein QUF74_13130 [Candidatus Halobeggiatoa sp. HSG11]|nr:hypothetical protein [Candidatus Halobeggiatoa sp. HSG11]
MTPKNLLGLKYLAGLTLHIGGLPKKLYDFYQSNHWQSLLLESFFGTRTFNFKPNENTTTRQVLLPFIDLVNHNFYADNFKVQPNTQTHQNEVSIINSKTQSDSDETFVNYNNSDTLDMYLLYNYFEPQAPFVRSIPLNISIPTIGTLEIESRIGSFYQNQLPPTIEDLRIVIPSILKNENKTLTVAHLLIPGPNMPRALRRVLRFW